MKQILFLVMSAEEHKDLRNAPRTITLPPNPPEEIVLSVEGHTRRKAVVVESNGSRAQILIGAAAKVDKIKAYLAEHGPAKTSNIASATGVSPGNVFFILSAGSRSDQFMRSKKNKHLWEIRR
jgi:hypothetical protein